MGKRRVFAAGLITCTAFAFIWPQTAEPQTDAQQAAADGQSKRVPSPTDPIAETNVLMRAKLTSSQRVLEGLLSDNERLIVRGAKEMKSISEAAEWPRARDPVYEHFAAEFRRQCAKLEQQALAGNQDGASFTYLHMTTTCLDCHNYVRKSLRMAIQGDGGVQLIPAHVP